MSELYQSIRDHEQRAECYLTEDAEYILAGYGISGRMARSAVDELRKQGVRAGLIRPITLFPFPEKAFNAALDGGAKHFFEIEMSNGQMIDDVKLAIECRRPVTLINRMGGHVPGVGEIAERVLAEVNK